MPEHKDSKPRPRQFVMLQLDDVQKAHLKRLIAGRRRKTGIKQTMAGVLRQILMETKE